MNNRLKEFRESLTDSKGKKYSQTRLADEMHITRDILANYEQGRVEMTPLFISMLCTKYDLNETWLRTGEGEMFAPVSREKEIARITKRILGDELPPEVEALIRVLANMDEIESRMFVKFVENYKAELEKQKENLSE